MIRVILPQGFAKEYREAEDVELVPGECVRLWTKRAGLRGRAEVATILWQPGMVIEPNHKKDLFGLSARQLPPFVASMYKQELEDFDSRTMSWKNQKNEGGQDAGKIENRGNTERADGAGRDDWG